MLVSQTSFGGETGSGSVAKCQLFSQASMLTLLTVTLSGLLNQAVMLNPLSPDSDQDQFSPNHISICCQEK